MHPVVFELAPQGFYKLHAVAISGQAASRYYSLVLLWTLMQRQQQLKQKQMRVELRQKLMRRQKTDGKKAS
jgi:peptidoglycan biosynthesis protein MviN/MurJ (putative lipid II flippase)